MKILQPSYEIWNQADDLDGMYRQIERAGRVCYKSEDHQTEDSARPFCQRMINSQHYAMLEHGTVYLVLDMSVDTEQAIGEFYAMDRFSRCRQQGDILFVTTNLRILAENDHLDDLKYFTERQPQHEQRITVHFTTQVAITREFNRHRVNSMAEQSTRYCNYSKAKFGNELTLNLPTWIRDQEKNDYTDAIEQGTVEISDEELATLCGKVISGEATVMENWIFANASAEKAYMNLIAQGCKPQEARVILPLDVNTELVHTAFVSDWCHFFDLRALDKTGAAHPDAKVLALPLYREFIEQGVISEA